MRTRMSLTLIATVLGLSALLWTQDARSLPEYAQARDVARQVLEESRTLLMKELASKGAAGAVDACAAVALDLGRKHEAAGWRVRRVSTRLRNPADAPDAYEATVLGRFAADGVKPEAEHVGVSTEQGKRYLRYLKPIVIPGELCLKCHGDPASMDPKVVEILRSRYPQDRATEHQVGDLRGAVSVRIPLSK